MSVMRTSEMHLHKIKKPPLERKWYQCPYCQKSALIYDDTAVCSGVFMKCKFCKQEFEVIIKH